MVDTLMTKTKQESNHKCSNGQFTCYESYGYLYLEDDCPGGNSSEVPFCPFCGLDYNKLKAKHDKNKLHSPTPPSLVLTLPLVEGANRVHLSSNGDHFT